MIATSFARSIMASVWLSIPLGLFTAFDGTFANDTSTDSLPPSPPSVSQKVSLANEKEKRIAAPVKAEAKRDKATIHEDGIGSPGLKLAQAKMRALVPLLENLKKRAPHQYEKAIRDLDRSAKRLESIRKRDEKLYELAAREWTLRSEAQLLKAKARVVKSNMDAEQWAQLEGAILEVQIARLEREIELSDAKKKGFEERLKHLKRQRDKTNAPDRAPKNPKRQTSESAQNALMNSDSLINAYSSPNRLLPYPALPCPVQEPVVTTQFATRFSQYRFGVYQDS